jgi:ATP-dependent Clp protease ATP-binding subunit ClpA
MFERYTEKARRAIFFARYEASQAGSPVIATEHLLLGVLRESRNLQGYLRVDRDELADQLARVSVVRPKISTSVDLPLDDHCKRVLAHAAQEAERLGHPHIGTEHMLLGVMREDEGGAAQVLRAMGAASVDEVRKAIAEAPPSAQSDPSRPPGIPLFPSMILVDEETGRELSLAIRFVGVPKIGEAIVVATQGASERFRVVDVQWNFMEGAQANELVQTGIEVRIRKEPAINK